MSFQGHFLFRVSRLRILAILPTYRDRDGHFDKSLRVSGLGRRSADIAHIKLSYSILPPNAGRFSISSSLSLTCKNERLRLASTSRVIALCPLLSTNLLTTATSPPTFSSFAVLPHYPPILIPPNYIGFPNPYGFENVILAFRRIRFSLIAWYEQHVDTS